MKLLQPTNVFYLHLYVKIHVKIHVLGRVQVVWTRSLPASISYGSAERAGG
ncbi:MAG: hypothetical protein ACI80V_003022 [Rhodothermales bacterium]|jgi:hypothetical protein